jgi:hypothetical protein
MHSHTHVCLYQATGNHICVLVYCSILCRVVAKLQVVNLAVLTKMQFFVLFDFGLFSIHGLPWMLNVHILSESKDIELCKGFEQQES